MQLGWTDGVSIFPVNSALMSSSKYENRYTEANELKADARTCGGKRRAEAVISKTKVAIDMLKQTISEYCDRLIEGSTKTCKQMGYVRLYDKQAQDDPVIREYKRSYKAHNARVRRGQMSREEFNAWAEEARRQRELALALQLTLEEFKAWLDRDKQK